MGKNNLKKRKFIYLFLGVVGIAIILIIWKTISDGDQSTEITEEEMEEIQEEQEEIQASIDENFENDSTPTDQLKKYETMSENSILQEVHKMTHQKVLADKKWGTVEITKERVEKLYTVVKNRDDLEHDALLLDSLSPWVEGDFDNAVEVHNRIWTIQNGSVGKASRLLTPEEEQEYIKKNFD
ncbi:DUF6241 domain-containing protein [Aquibacillus saliphilus]|uniref:DUF6241 domain-containing protein n=1 Tax=Aquibacillus saliphilus TaxID=1909422 RepID=UPI001CF0C22C|nr:DUF6241 domain-containing protein [Aquibacillus saliphilus]